VQIDLEKQILQAGIREWVCFGQPVTERPGSHKGNWRMKQGVQWHQLLAREQQSLHGSKLQTEIPIEGELIHENWTFRLSGRIDQLLIETEACLIREVKTTSIPLPTSLTQLRNTHADYLEQLACYQFFWLQQHPETPHPGSELLLIHPESGMRQSLRLEADPESLLLTRLRHWAEYLQSRARAAERRTSIKPASPFRTLRPEQIRFRQQLLKLPAPTTQGNCLCIEAPTGFGKTALALEWAFHGLASGKWDRILYLTSKQSGQIQVLKELQNPGLSSLEIPAFQMRNLERHLRLCPLHPCHCRLRQEGPQAPVQPTPLSKVQSLLADGSPEDDTLAQYARRTQTCPRILSKQCLGQSDLWIADYNYVFSPHSNTQWENIPDFSPSSSLLLVDEAHNLHDRVAANHSFRLFAPELYDQLERLHAQRFPASGTDALRQLARFTSGQARSPGHGTRTWYELRDLMENLNHNLEKWMGMVVNLPDDLADAWFLWQQNTAILRCAQEHTHLLWSENDGTINLNCTDAAPFIAPILTPYRQVVLMSATLPPLPYLRQQLGLDAGSAPQIVLGESPWRKHAYRVAIDGRIDTRYQERERYHDLIAQTLSTLVETSHLPVVAFFPSHLYAETLKSYLEVRSPWLRSSTIDRSLDGEAQALHLEDALNSSDLICLVLGGSLGEGIDALGGRVDTIAVISPALPEVNPIRKSKLSTFNDPEEAFQHTYLIPGMTKINQALGRVVRTPDHHAKVLLICKRFLKAEYHDLLDQDFSSTATIRDEHTLQEWARASGDDTP
jgi:Rad3-related DNA helicase